jgi:hypothetical protein
MQNLVSTMSRRRRTAGIAAAAMMAGGLAGTVLLTPGTAFADTGSQANTATSITASKQWNYPVDVSTVRITVTVTAQSGSSAPTGDVIVSTGPDTNRWCDAKLDQSSGLVSTGNCYIKYLRDGSYNLTASYAGQSGFASSVSAKYPIAVGGAPVWKAASPPLSATPNGLYDYTFGAVGNPQPRYALASGAPGWLHIQRWNGEVYGQIPWWVHSFSYSVIASNSVGSTTAGPFAVAVSPAHQQAHLTTQLFCPRYMLSGQSGSCTLVVRNDGPGAAVDTTAQISLPAQLRARWCGWGWVRCSVTGGTVKWHLGTVYGWQAKAVSVSVTARLFPQAWWQHSVRVTVNGAAFWGRQWWWQQHASYTSTHVTIFRR